MPPTWIVLALAKVNDPTMDPLLLSFLGAICSSIGRFIMLLYSSFFSKYLGKSLSEHASEIKELFEKKGSALFLGTFIYSLSPFPSNLIFIAGGLTKVDSKPIFSGFFIGRLISYFVLIVVSNNLLERIGGYSEDSPLKYAIDIIGILAAVSILFIDWRKLLPSLYKK